MTSRQRRNVVDFNSLLAFQILESLRNVLSQFFFIVKCFSKSLLFRFQYSLENAQDNVKGKATDVDFLKKCSDIFSEIIICKGVQGCT